MQTRAQPVPFAIAGLPARRETTSWWEDVSFALMKPLGMSGSLVIGFGVVLSLVAQAPIFVVNLVALFTFFWFYNNYFFRTVQSASAGRDELPDSPVGYEALGVLRLLWILIGTYIGLFLPAIALVIAARFVPAVAALPLVPLLVASFAWPLVAYPMTLLVTSHTLNPGEAFNYFAILRSMADTAGSYLRVLGFFLLIAALPHAYRLVLDTSSDSHLTTFVTMIAEPAWTMYSMIALALFLGRFYVREERRLGWFR